MHDGMLFGSIFIQIPRNGTNLSPVGLAVSSSFERLHEAGDEPSKFMSNVPHVPHGIGTNIGTKYHDYRVDQLNPTS